MMRSFGSFEKVPDEKKIPHSLWISGGTALVGLSTFLLNSGWKVSWLRWMLFLYLGLFVLSLVWGRLKAVIRRISGSWAWREVRQFHGREMKMALASLEELLSSDRTTSLPALMRDVAGWNEVVPKIPWDAAHLETVRAWLEHLKGWSLNVKWNRDLSGWVGEFDSVIFQTNRLFLAKHRQYEDAMRGTEWGANRGRQLRKEWNIRRERYAAFVMDWEKLRSKINDRAGSRVAAAYFESLPPLE